jgi:hypothetical protein
VLPIIEGWLRTTAFNAVIWTDLVSNFVYDPNEGFLNAAFNYLDNLPDICKANARDYINRAPQQTQTDLRRFLQVRGWL